MKNAVQKINAFFLAIILLIASNTYAVTTHFCGDTLVDVSFVGKTKGCGMEISENNSHSKLVLKKRCCSQTTQLIESDIESNILIFYKFTVDTIDFDICTSNYISFYSEVLIEYDLPKDNSPPDLKQDFQVLFETFLI